MGIIDYSIKNRIVTLFFTVIIIIGGIISYVKVGKLEDPEFKVKQAIILTVYPGATPHEVELEITNKIENALHKVPNVKTIKSVSKTDYSEVKIELSESIPSDKVEQYWDDVRKKIHDVQPSLPAGTLEPVVLDGYGDVYGMFFAITSDGYSMQTLDKYVRYIRRELQKIPGVGQTTFVAENKEAVEVVVDRAKLASYGVNDKLLMASLNSQDLPAYTPALYQGGQYLRVNVQNKFRSLKDLGNFVIFTKPFGKDQNVVRLKDVAEIREVTATPVLMRMRYNGMQAIGLMLSPQKGSNVIDTGEALDKELEKIKENIPVGIEIHKVYYQPDLVKSAISVFMTNLIESVIVVVGILLLTMGMRTGLIIGSGLILSILGTIIFMIPAHIDMQRVSLGSFIIAMGMLVDNSIVIADGILVGFEKGEDRFTALTRPTKQVAIPLLGATSIAIIAFLPLYLMPTDAGEYVSSLFWIVAISLGLSWVLALTQIPVFCDIFLKVDPNKKMGKRKANFYKKCRSFLVSILHHRKLSVIVIVVSFIISMVLFFQLPFTFFPDSDKKGFVVNVWTPVGTTIDRTNAISKVLEKKILEDKGVINVTASVGGSPARYYIATIPELPTESLSQLIINVKDLPTIDRVGKNIVRYAEENIPDVNVEIRKYVNGVPSKYPVALQIHGPDPAVLRDFGRQVMARAKTIKGAKDIQTDWKNKILVWKPKMSIQNEKRRFVTPFDIANSFSRATNGLPIGKYIDGTKVWPIVLKEKFGQNNVNLNNIGQAPVWGMDIFSTPLNEFIEKNKLSWENPEIRRQDSIRTLTVELDSDGTKTVETIRRELVKKIKGIKLPNNYSFSWGGEYKKQQENTKAVMSSVPLQIVLMFSICVLLFKTLKDPIIIFLILPLSFIGIAPGLFFTGRSFGFMSIIGAISLSGMMIKNSIVLVDEIKIEINKLKKDPYVAVIDSAVSRIRPVSMTSGTTILGMVPLVFDPLYGDMAITIIFGLTASTILTLFVVPLLYAMFYKIYPTKDSAELLKNDKIVE